jgi:hypothetical protein
MESTQSSSSSSDKITFDGKDRVIEQLRQERDELSRQCAELRLEKANAYLNAKEQAIVDTEEMIDQMHVEITRAVRDQMITDYQGLLRDNAYLRNQIEELDHANDDNIATIQRLKVFILDKMIAQLPKGEVLFYDFRPLLKGKNPFASS